MAARLYRFTIGNEQLCAQGFSNPMHLIPPVADADAPGAVQLQSLRVLPAPGRTDVSAWGDGDGW